MAVGCLCFRGALCFKHVSVSVVIVAPYLKPALGIPLWPLQQFIAK